MKRISYVHSLILQRKHKGFVHVFCFIFLMSNPQARTPNPVCNGTGSILDYNVCVLRIPELLGGKISYPWLLHLFSACTYIFADLSSEWFPCLDNPSLGIAYPNFPGVSEFKSRSSCEIAGWPAVSKMISSVHILDLIFFFSFFKFPNSDPPKVLGFVYTSPQKLKEHDTLQISVLKWKGRQALKFFSEMTFKHSTPTTGTSSENTWCSHFTKGAEFPKHTTSTSLCCNSPQIQDLSLS